MRQVIIDEQVLRVLATAAKTAQFGYDPALGSISPRRLIQAVSEAEYALVWNCADTGRASAAT